MSELCEYELKRLDQIERNKEMLRQLGINDAVAEIHAAHQPTKAKPKKQKAKAAPKGPTRKSRRLDGEADSSDGGDDNSHNSQYESRDPNDVSGMTESEFHRFVDDVRLAVLETVLEMEHLSEEHCERLRAANDPEAGWLGPFAVHTARYGSVGEGPISKPNLRSCLKSVMQLASGAGFHSDKKETGTFAAARPIHLGWTAAGCDALRAEAQLWLPLEKAPADIVGMQVPSGETVPARPTRKLDLSNGWALNHPLIKVKKYCEHLDECRENGWEETMYRLSNDDKYLIAKKAAEEAAERAAKGCARKAAEEAQTAEEAQPVSEVALEAARAALPKAMMEPAFDEMEEGLGIELTAKSVRENLLDFVDVDLSGYNSAALDLVIDELLEARGLDESPAKRARTQ